MLPETNLTWPDRLARVVTVWGLGIGTVVSLSLLAGLCLHLHTNEFIFCGVLGSVTGATLGLGTLYQRFVQRHTRAYVRADDPVSYSIALIMGNAVLFFVASLIAFLAVPLLIGFVISMEFQKRKEMTLMQKTERYIGSIVPSMLFSN